MKFEINGPNRFGDRKSELAILKTVMRDAARIYGRGQAITMRCGVPHHSLFESGGECEGEPIHVGFRSHSVDVAKCLGWETEMYEWSPDFSSQQPECSKCTIYENGCELAGAGVDLLVDIGLSGEAWALMREGFCGGTNGDEHANMARAFNHEIPWMGVQVSWAGDTPFIAGGWR